MDLVISVDTSVAHMAGAMGQPLWLLLSFSADFRWMLDRADSPWYPTAKLYRQPRFDDWQSVIAAVREDLARLKVTASST
jgi:ADP-heptose:LPS heptosyltransferase